MRWRSTEVDEKQFDALVKRLTQNRLSRLDALRGMAASALTGLAAVGLVRTETEAKPRHKGKSKAHKHKTKQGQGHGKARGKDHGKQGQTRGQAKVTLCHKPGTPDEQT